MRLNVVPKNLFGRIALRAGVVPTPLGETIVAMTLARTSMVATKFGTTHKVAIGCELDPHATKALLFALDGAGYVHYKEMR